MNKYKILLFVVITYCASYGQTNSPLDTAKYYDFVEVMPTFKGDINSTTAQSEIMAKMKVSCAVPADSNAILIHFIVETDGRVNKAIIRKGICDEMNSLALAEVKKLKYKPGRQDGKPVRVKEAILLKF
ncbi:MAG: energy transducer TonB [Chitinophagales bacterium]